MDEIKINDNICSSFKLWEADAPGHQEGLDIPTLHYYPAKSKLGNGAVIICAGGAYLRRSPHEDVGYAEYLNSIGLDAFVLDYRVKPCEFPYPLLDARRAIRFVRKNADRFGVDTNKIAIMGSSAGGHLAALTSTYKEKIDGEGIDDIDTLNFVPNAQILCYPVLDVAGHKYSFEVLLGERFDDHENVTPSLLADQNTPPCFLWHTSTDTCVDVNGSLRYCHKLHELGVSTEMHIYPVGIHGLGLANDEKHDCKYIQGWAKNLEAWLKEFGYIRISCHNR